MKIPRKNVHDVFEKHSDDEHLKFERIPKAERLHPSDDLCGLLKVASLMKNPAKFSMNAGHDQIWLADWDDLKQLTEEDVVYLLRCGIWWDGDVDCLSTFT